MFTTSITILDILFYLEQFLMNCYKLMLPVMGVEYLVSYLQSKSQLLIDILPHLHHVFLKGTFKVSISLPVSLCVSLSYDTYRDTQTHTHTQASLRIQIQVKVCPLIHLSACNKYSFLGAYRSSLNKVHLDLSLMNNFSVLHTGHKLRENESYVAH